MKVGSVIDGELRNRLLSLPKNEIFSFEERLYLDDFDNV
jgi:hypothetical protein